MVPNLTSCSRVSLSFLNLRMVSVGTVESKRRHDHVDARAVRQARVANRRGLVDPAADLADDALTDVEQLLVVAKPDAGFLDLAFELRCRSCRSRSP